MFTTQQPSRATGTPPPAARIGRHIGRPLAPYFESEAARLHALGFCTIDAGTLRDLDAAGINPRDYYDTEESLV